MGNYQTRQPERNSFIPGGNVRRIYDTVSSFLISLTEERRNFHYSSYTEKRLKMRFEIVFIQLDSVYLGQSPKHEDFLPSPAYSKEDEKPLTEKEQEEIFDVYYKECIRYMNSFCNEYCSLAKIY